MLPLHWKSCFDRNTPHITEFATVAKSLPHSLRKAHKSLISNIFLFQYRFSIQKTAFFTSFCTAHFDIQEITLTFTFQNGGTSREWC